jgi:glycosyltransferase involved in cell wall biosynthesis
VVRAFRRLDLSGYDVVLCSTTFAAKAIRPPTGAAYHMYCYAPFRLLWSAGSYFPRAAFLLSPLLSPLRAWDRRETRRAGSVATTSHHMAARLSACYGVEARVIPAPIEWNTFRSGGQVGDYYLVASRLNQYKRIDLAIDACRTLGRRLLVVGDGPLRGQLERRAGAETQFLGRVSEEQLRQLYAGCRALLFPAEEDYGLVPLEVQASGRPVIAFGRGGARETIVEGLSGLFFERQDCAAVIDAIERFERTHFSSEAIRADSRRFDVPVFLRRLRSFVGLEAGGDGEDV